jgi:DNA-binding NtrC family response regulator
MAQQADAGAGAGGQIDVTPDGVALLAAQHWRGNIRELRNVLEQAAMRGDSQTIDAKQLEAVLREAGVTLLAQPAPVGGADDVMDGSAAAIEQNLTRPLSLQIAELEGRAIRAAMQATRGNKLATSRLLGISRATLYERLENPVN